MPDSKKAFAEALARHEPSALKRAFNLCNRVDDLEKYDRTTLGRWLNGSVPSRGDFIACMAEHLDDLGIYEAWAETTASTSSVDVKSVVTRFKGLGAEEKAAAFAEIKDAFASTSPSVRRNFSMRVAIHDLDEELFLLRVGVDWEGQLPPNAKVVFIAEHDELVDSYNLPDCIYRDLIALTDDQFKRAFEATDGEGFEQSLSSSSPDDKETPRTLFSRQMVDPGVYDFSNESIERAQIKLRVRYPYPRHYGVFPVIFGQYQVVGRSEITLEIHTDSVTNPVGYGFAGSVHYQTNQLPDEVVVTAGNSSTLFDVGTGFVLSWSER